jgi:hypothetical protein
MPAAEAKRYRGITTPLIFIGMMCVSPLLRAQTQIWTADFQITNLYVAGAENFHYRVYGMPPVPACNNGTTWSYVNESDSGSKGYIAALLSAFTAGKYIRVLVTPANGFCHIAEIFVSP